MRTSKDAAIAGDPPTAVRAVEDGVVETLQPPLLELSRITKRFPGILANDAVDFDLRAGEVHALLGENGAGKSRLMHVLYGLYRPDGGEIRLRGIRAEIGSPRDAIKLGIGMVHQHFMLVPVMTVAENIVLAREPHRGPFLDMTSAERRVADCHAASASRSIPTPRCRTSLLPGSSARKS